MNSKKDNHNIIDLMRFKVMVEAYGANPDKWPVEERMDTLRFLKTSHKAKAFFDIQDKLDQQLNKTYDEEVNLAHLSLGILDALSKLNSTQDSIFEKWLGWLIPTDTTTMWKPALAAVLPLAMGITYGALLSLSDAEDKWDQEFYLSSLIDNKLSTEFYLENAETPISEVKND
jgi:hypothetical protein